MLIAFQLKLQGSGLHAHRERDALLAAMLRAAGAGCTAAAAESPMELAQRLGAERAAAVQGLAAEHSARRAAEDRAAAAECRTAEVAEVCAIMKGYAVDSSRHGRQGKPVSDKYGRATPGLSAGFGREWRADALFHVRLHCQFVLYSCRHWAPQRKPKVTTAQQAHNYDETDDDCTANILHPYSAGW